MTSLETSLAASLGLTLVAVTILAGSRRRLGRLLAVEQAKGHARELAARAALQERLATEVALLVAPLRELLEEQARARAASAADVAQLVASFRALVEWFAKFSGEQYAALRAQEQRAPEPAQVAAGLGPRPPRSPPRRGEDLDTGDSGAWPDRAPSATAITLPSMKAPLDPNIGGSRL